MKKDGVKVYLNDDNSIQREDCLLLTDGVTVVPFTDTHAYQVQLGDVETANVIGAAPVTSRRSPKAASLFHSALGHSGNRRIRSSNIIMGTA